MAAARRLPSDALFSGGHGKDRELDAIERNKADFGVGTDAQYRRWLLASQFLQGRSDRRGYSDNPRRWMRRDRQRQQGRLIQRDQLAEC